MDFQKRKLPWYDSYWHSSFLNAQKLIAFKYTNQLNDFYKEFEVLRTDRTFKTIELTDIISPELHLKIRDFTKDLQNSDFKKYELYQFGRLIQHDLPFFNEIQQQLESRVSNLVNEEVESAYNFLSLYNVLGVLPPHMDAPMAKWTLDFCIDQSEEWPIFLSKVVPWPENFDYSEDWMEKVKNNPENEFKKFVLKPGKAVLFGGSSQWHYRERIANKNSKKYCNLVFFHFIPKGTKSLCNPKEWASYFKIPELNEVIISPTN